ncbi:hypothetical protein WMF12_28715 [Sorangium sp. So ce363]
MTFLNAELNALSDSYPSAPAMAEIESRDNPASSALTRRRLSWEPALPGLLDDLDGSVYFEQE